MNKYQSGDRVVYVEPSSGGVSFGTAVSKDHQYIFSNLKDIVWAIWDDEPERGPTYVSCRDVLSLAEWELVLATKGITDA